MSNLVELTDDQVSESQAQTRSRGDYDLTLAEFADSGMRGAAISTDSGTFAGKKATAVKSGLENAKGRLNKANAGSGDAFKIVVFKSGTGDSATEQVRILRVDAAASDES